MPPHLYVRDIEVGSLTCLGLVCYTSWVKRWSKAMDFLQTFFIDKTLLWPISEKTYVLEQSLKETYSFATSLTTRRVTQ